MHVNVVNRTWKLYCILRKKCILIWSHVLSFTRYRLLTLRLYSNLKFWHCKCEIQDPMIYNAVAWKEQKAACLSKGWVPSAEKKKIKALPEKTLGILVRKLFTVRMGMPFFSSCMRAITSSIWTAHSNSGREEEEGRRERERGKARMSRFHKFSSYAEDSWEKRE